MNPHRASLAWFILGVAGAAAPDQYSPPAGSPDATILAPAASPRRSAAELEQLLAPIALYPDALIALLLPACTAPTDIVLAARQMRETGNDRAQIEHRSWDESVKSLTYYPDLLRWMDENLQWTRQVGEAFAEQPVEVMQAIQRLRSQARAAGTLVDTQQQQVLADAEIIRIVPAQAETIFVPSYQPAMVFLNEPVGYGRPAFVTFGVGWPVGAWLAFECDWRRHTIWVGNRHRRWTGHDWRQPVVPIPVVASTYGHRTEVRPWRPPVTSLRTYRSVSVAPATPAVGSFRPSSGVNPGTFPTGNETRPSGLPWHPRPVISRPPALAVTPKAAPVPLAPPLVAPSFAPVPAAAPAPAAPFATTAVTPYRRGPADRQGSPDSSSPAFQRHATPAGRPPPASPPPAVSGNVPSTNPRPSAPPSSHSFRPAPPPSNSLAPAAPPVHARPAPAPAATSPAAAPAPAAPPSRPEAETERGAERRVPNERVR